MPLNYRRCVPESDLATYACDPCMDGEKGRVRGCAYIHKSLKADLTKINLESKEWWETQIEAGLIRIIPKTRGTYDGGTVNPVDGFGSVKQKKVSKTHIVTVNDPNHTGNDEFYNALENAAEAHDYYFAFITGKELRVATEPLDAVEAKDPIEEDVESLVLWQVINTWTQSGSKKNIPIYALGEVVDVFECVDED